MKKMLALSLALAAAVSVSACQTPQQQNALVGGALGAGAGALVGSAVIRRQRRRRAGGRGDRRGVGRADRRRRDADLSGPVRALGLRLQRQPRLRGVLLSVTLIRR